MNKKLLKLMARHLKIAKEIELVDNDREGQCDPNRNSPLFMGYADNKKKLEQLELEIQEEITSKRDEYYDTNDNLWPKNIIANGFSLFCSDDTEEIEFLIDALRGLNCKHVCGYNGVEIACFFNNKPPTEKDLLDALVKSLVDYKLTRSEVKGIFTTSLFYKEWKK